MTTTTRPHGETCRRFTYHELGGIVWRRCSDCGTQERGRWVTLADPRHQGETQPPYCTACGGDGWLPSKPTPATCPYCGGTGRAR
jgi:hypothetical protein